MVCEQRLRASDDDDNNDDDNDDDDDDVEGRVRDGAAPH
jgi:hypothetical protein